MQVDFIAMKLQPFTESIKSMVQLPFLLEKSTSYDIDVFLIVAQQSH